MLRLLRIPNLLIIAFTLYSFRYLVEAPYYGMSGIDYQMDSLKFGLMVAVTLFIAVCGYLINDYMDADIDRINRPDRPVPAGKIEKQVLFGTAIITSLISVAGMLLLSFMMKSPLPAAVFSLALFTVWWYALRLKKSLVWGNMAVAFMSSLTLGMAWFFEWIMIRKAGLVFYEIRPLTHIAVGITVFAFLLSLVREMVKDLEDMEGDEQFGCRTLPIQKGKVFTRNLILILSGVLLILLIYAQFRLIRMYFPLVAGWLFFFAEIPLMFFILRIFKATTRQEYRKLSTLLKWIMVGGILSMAMIWVNFRI